MNDNEAKCRSTVVLGFPFGQTEKLGGGGKRPRSHRVGLPKPGQVRARRRREEKIG